MLRKDRCRRINSAAVPDEIGDDGTAIFSDRSWNQSTPHSQAAVASRADGRATVSVTSSTASSQTSKFRRAPLQNAFPSRYGGFHAYGTAGQLRRLGSEPHINSKGTGL